MWPISDSNPRRGDYGNAVKAFLVVVFGTIGLVLLGLMFVTGHGKAAIIIIVALCFVVFIVAGLLAGQHERDR